MSCHHPDSVGRASRMGDMLPHLLPALARLVGGTSFVVLFWGVVLEKWAMVLLVVALVCLQVVVLEELAAVGGLGLVVSSFGVLSVQREAGVHPFPVSGSL